MNLENFSSYTLLYDIASRIYATSAAKSEKFSILSAFHIIGSTAQLAWSTESGVLTSLYQMLGASSAFGKNHFYNAINKYTSAVDHSLIGGDPGSAQGFVSGLASWNTTSYLIDEFHVWYADMMKNPGRKPMLQNFLKLYNGADQLDGTQLKASLSANIYMPRVSLLGVGTLYGLAQLMTPEMLSGGLLGRFLIWHDFISESSVRKPKPLIPDPREIEWLKKIYMPSKERPVQSKPDNLEKYNTKKHTYKHESVYHLKHIIKMTPEADALLDEIFEDKKKEVIAESEAYFEKDGDQTGIKGRIVFMIERLAAILALSKSIDAEPVITSTDVMIANMVLDEHECGLIFLISKNHQTEFQKHKQRFIEFFRRRPGESFTRNDLTNETRKVDDNIMHKIFVSLADEGIIQIIDHKGLEVEEMALRFKIPRGVIFRSPSF